MNSAIAESNSALTEPLATLSLAGGAGLTRQLQIYWYRDTAHLYLYAASNGVNAVIGGALHKDCCLYRHPRFPHFSAGSTTYSLTVEEAREVESTLAPFGLRIEEPVAS